MPQLPALVTALAHDDAAVRDLRHDPSALARSLNLTPENVAALRSADRFFQTEKPIVDQPRQPQAALAFPPSARVFAAAPPAAPGLTASADTGTLLPGPTSGTYTITSSATATATATGTRPPAPGPAPGAPAPRPPASGAPLPPTAPGIPAVPSEPAQRPPSAPPSVVTPPVQPSPGAAPPSTLPSSGHGGHCGCEVAIVAMVSEVCATANTAIAAITASARRRERADHVRTGQSTS